MKLRALFLFAVLLLVSPSVASAQVPSCTLVTKPSTVFIGESFTLSWQSARADSGTITGVKGTVGPKGSINLIPTQSTRFVGVFTGPGGKATCEAIVLVQRTNGTPTTVVEAAGVLQVVPPPGSTGAPSTIGQPGSVQEPEKLGDPGTMAPAPTLPQGSDIKISGTKGSGLVPCDGINCQACHLAQLGQNIINFLVGLSIPLAAAMFAYAGFLYFSSSVLDKIEKAKKIFTSVLIGFAIVVGGFLVVETILHTLLKPDYFTSWNKVECVNSGRLTNAKIGDLLGSINVLNSVAPQAPINGVSVGQSSVYGCSSGTYNPDDNNCYGSNGEITPARLAGSNVAFNQYNGSISGSIDGYINSDTSSGPDGGNLACAWAVNNVLTGAGVPTIDGDSVAGMKSVLDGGRGELVDPTAGTKGDIVVWKEGPVSHVGFCYNSGCTQTISNSSSGASFNRVGGLVDRGVTGQVYKLR